jgi:5-methylcytosine-specific restriction endonuclease McrA
MADPSPEQMKRERQKAKDLKKSRWWHNLTQNSICYYCETPLTFATATMDHIVPISRGGRSTKGNLVACCAECNELKRSLTPVEWVAYLEGQLKKS